MKSIKLDGNFDLSNKVSPKIDQKIISLIGQSIYAQDDVKEVVVKVGFKDGTAVIYTRDEEDDEFEEFKKSKVRGEK